jgi:CHAD domain-containing protein
MTTTPAADAEKLGPIGPLASVWESDTRVLIVNAFRAATADAAVAAERASTDLAISVHEFRKALRRARAVLALVRPAMNKDEHIAIRNELRSGRRAVSTERDHTVAISSLASLALESAERAVADGLLGVLREHGPNADEVSSHMLEGSRRAGMQVAALDAALPARIEWSTIVDGLARTYRDARDARKAAKRSTRAFHRWRRRSKEFDAQLTLIASYGGPRLAAIQSDYGEVSRVLGPIADLLMLSEFIEAHGKAWDREGFDVLAASIDRLISTQVGTARKDAKDLFKRRPAELARKVTKAIRKDATAPIERVEGDDPGDSHE